MILSLLSLIGLTAFPSLMKGRLIPPTDHVTVIFCDGWRWEDFHLLGEPVSLLLRHGALGLLSGASGDLRGQGGVYLTLRMGRRQSASFSPPFSLTEWLSRHGVKVVTEGDSGLTLVVGEHYGVQGEAEKQVFFLWTTKAKLLSTLRGAIQALPPDGVLMLVVPNSPQTGWTTRRLTPIVLFGKSVPTGLLTSPTTRIPGLVSSVDFAPTLLHQLRVSIPPFMTGRPMRVIPYPTPQAYLHRLDEKSSLNPEMLRPLTFGAVAIIIVALTLVGLARWEKRWRFPARFLVLSGMAFPPSLLLSAPFPSWTAWDKTLQGLGVSLIVGAISVRKGGWEGAGWVCVFSSLVALLTVPFVWMTPLGYSLTTGWRYFGIGNWGIGILLASGLFAVRLLPLPRWLVILWSLFVPFLTGVSFWGANLGGAITLAFSFALAWTFYPSRRPLWPQSFALVSAAVIGVTAISGVTELLLPPEWQSHFGQWLTRLLKGDFTGAVDVAANKGRLWWQFTKALPLNFAVLLAFATFTFVLPSLRRFLPPLANLSPTFLSVFSGAWVGFVLNDSGIQIIAMSLVYVGGMFLLAVVEGRGDSGGMDQRHACRP